MMRTIALAVAVLLTSVTIVMTTTSTRTQAQVDAQNVNVVNTPFVRDAENPGRQSFQFSQMVADIATRPNESQVVVFTVPRGKRAVIRFASVEASVADGQVIACVETTVGDVNGMYAVPLSLQGSFRTGAGGRADFYVAGHEVQFYADGGTDVIFEIARSTMRGSGEAKVTLAGYYVDVP
jgi:hypothetical protein